MVNLDYQSMCLNADDTGGLANGHPVQLWNCDVNTSNEAWDWPYWEDQVIYNNQSSAQFYVNGTDYVLDAVEQGLGNGDQIQIWQWLSGSNQLWHLYYSANI